MDGLAAGGWRRGRHEPSRLAQACSSLSAGRHRHARPPRSSKITRPASHPLTPVLLPMLHACVRPAAQRQQDVCRGCAVYPAHLSPPPPWQTFLPTRSTPPRGAAAPPPARGGVGGQRAADDEQGGSGAADGKPGRRPDPRRRSARDRCLDPLSWEASPAGKTLACTPLTRKSPSGVPTASRKTCTTSPSSSWPARHGGMGGNRGETDEG